MRARLQKFLPIVLIALAMQVLAPILACWAAGGAAADPLPNVVICHSSEAPSSGLDDRTGAPAHAGACALCCLVQGSAPIDSPQAALSIPVRHGAPVAWRALDTALVASHGGSNAQARAPPQVS